jgi:hypothetical protein
MSNTFYRWLGMTVWKFAIAYGRQKYGRQVGVGAALIVVILVAAGYTAAKSRE